MDKKSITHRTSEQLTEIRRVIEAPQQFLISTHHGQAIYYRQGSCPTTSMSCRHDIDENRGGRAVVKQRADEIYVTDLQKLRWYYHLCPQLEKITGDCERLDTIGTRDAVRIEKLLEDPGWVRIPSCAITHDEVIGLPIKEELRPFNTGRRLFHATSGNNNFIDTWCGSPRDEMTSLPPSNDQAAVTGTHGFRHSDAIHIWHATNFCRSQRLHRIMYQRKGNGIVVDPAIVSSSPGTMRLALGTKGL